MCGEFRRIRSGESGHIRPASEQLVMHLDVPCVFIVLNEQLISKVNIVPNGHLISKVNWRSG